MWCVGLIGGYGVYGQIAKLPNCSQSELKRFLKAIADSNDIKSLKERSCEQFNSLTI